MKKNKKSIERLVVAKNSEALEPTCAQAVIEDTKVLEIPETQAPVDNSEAIEVADAQAITKDAKVLETPEAQAIIEHAKVPCSFFHKSVTCLTSFGQKTMLSYRSDPYSHLLWCFLLPFLIMGAVFAVMQTHPFGEASILVLDLNAQYIYFFEGLRDWIYGEGSILYNFAHSLGGEFMGIYAYYLASPFSYIVALFPKENITEAIFLILVLKSATAGLTMGLYLSHVVKTRRTTTIIFSCAYALSAWVVILQNNTMWMGNYILLPIIAWGIEELIRHGKYKIFFIALTLAIMSSFYIGYMMCFFVFLYAVFACFTKTKAERNPLGIRFHLPKRLVKIAYFSVLALAISSIIWIPASYSLQFGKSTFSNPEYTFDAQFNLFDMLSKFFFGSFDTMAYDGLPILYCGIFSLLLIPFYFVTKNIKAREKIGMLLFALLFVFSFNIEKFDLFWHGMQAPNWMLFRYAFMLVFLMLIMSAKAFDQIHTHSYRSFIFVGGVSLAVLFLCAYIDIPAELVLSLFTLPSVVFILIWTGFFAKMASKKVVASHALSIVALALVCFELFAGGIVHTVGLDEDVGISTHAWYGEFTEQWQPAVDHIKEEEGDNFFRLEKTYLRKANDAFALGYDGISSSTSTLNAKTIALLERMGISSRSNWIRYLEPMPVTDALFSVKYILAEENDEVPPCYDYKETVNTIDIYQNPYALPLAFASSSNIKTVSFTDTPVDEDGKKVPLPGVTYYDAHDLDTPFFRMNALFSNVLGEDVQIMTSAEDYGDVKKNISTDLTYYNNIFNSGNTRYRTKTPGATTSTISYRFEGVADKELYFYIPCERLYESSILLEGEKIATYTSTGTHGVLYLGDDFVDGKTYELTVRMEKEWLYMANEVSFFYWLEEDALAEATKKIQSSGLILDTFEDNHFEGTITVKDDQSCMMTTIPYDEGWNVYVDGEKVETYLIADAFIGFDITPGEHDIVFNYMPTIYIVAFVLFIVAVLLGTAYILTAYFYNRSKRLAQENPVLTTDNKSANQKKQ